MPKIVVKLTDEEENGIDGEFWDVNAPFPSDSVPCYDPGTCACSDRTCAR